MSADLLRRAATRLRESALAAGNVAPGAWLEAPSDPRPDRVLLAEGHTQAIATVYENCELPHLSGYLALVHPPVALALADLLDDEAENVDDDGCLYCVSGETLAVARAVLGEPEGGDRT